MRIAVIFTGGTIMSREQEDCFSISETGANTLLKFFSPEFEIEVFNPYTILSEQLDGDYLTDLIGQTGRILKENFDGIIIFHGTDTLQFSAAALSIAYGGADIPIVLVSANYVLSNKRSNGRDNLKYALEFIKLKKGGVYVSYKNSGENPAIYFGDSLLPHLPYCDKLYSTCGAYGAFVNGEFKIQNNSHRRESAGSFKLKKYSPVLWIKAACAMTLPGVDNYSAILLEAYHSGTLPTENEQLASFCKNCKIPVYLVGVSGEKEYASSKLFGELGLQILPPMSPVAAYIYLWKKYSGKKM